MKPRATAMLLAIFNRGWALPPILALVALLGLTAPAAAQSIAASNITTNSVTITLTRAGYNGNWHYSVSGSTAIACTGNISGDSVTITGLTQGSSHNVTAWSSCTGPPSSRGINGTNPETTFTTLSGPTLSINTSSAGNVTSTSIKMSMANYTGAWWYKHNQSGAGCVSGGTGATTVQATGLTPNTAYKFTGYSNSSCTTSITPAGSGRTLRVPVPNVKVFPLNEGFYVTWSAPSGGADNYEIQWKSGIQSYVIVGRYEPTTNTSVTIPGTGDNAITNGPEYTVSVRSTHTAASRFGERTEVKATAAVEDLTVSGIHATGATLTLGNYEGQGTWHFKQTTTTTGNNPYTACTAANETSVALTGLTTNVEYEFGSYKNDTCSESLAPAKVKFTPRHPPLTFRQGAIPSQALILNAPFSLTLPASSGGSGGVTYTFTPALPRGLTFNPETRTISGTPTQPQPATTYTYTATDADGNSTILTFIITVADLQPTFGTHTIGDRTYEQYRAIKTLPLPAASGGNGRLTYALTPAPPAGLTFDAATRTLSGTPTQAQPATRYTYTATDADPTAPDRATLVFRITVLTSTEKEMLEDVLAAQGRALLSGATGVIGARFRNPGASSLTGVGECSGEAPAPDGCTTGLLDTVARAMLGMSGAGSDAPADSLALADADETRPRGPGLTGTGAQPAWDWESLLWGRSFALPLNPTASPGSAWTLWGAGDIQGFEGAPRQSKYDGQVRSLYLGVDAQWQEHWLAGAALARSWGKTEYVTERGGREGQLETTLLSVYPYVRGTLGAGLEVWAIGGYGRGEAENTRPVAGRAVDTRDLTMAMGATGARQPMTEVGGVQLAVVGGAGYLSLATEGGNSVLADLDVAVNRARLAVEATYVAGGLAPYVQVGGRYDGGAGQTGAGLETVAGVRYTSERLAFEARGRWLAAHAADGYEEYGGLVRLAVKPLADGTGFRLHVAPRWGAADGAELLGGGATLLDGGALPGLGVNSVPSARTRALVLDSELGYGVAVFEGHGLLTPYGGFAFTGEETRHYRLGTRLGLAGWLTLSLEGSRREPAGPQPANQGVLLKLDGRF